jgi:hypothetical protein
MSAYIVSDNHINVIVSWFMDYRKDNQLWYELNGNFGYMGDEAAPRVAGCLYNQNVRSVNARYTEQTGNEGYIFTKISNAKEAYSLAEIAGALDGLEYQSCESDDYHTTDAYKIITSMRKDLLKRVQERDLGDNTTWSINELKTSPARFEIVSRDGYNID